MAQVVITRKAAQQIAVFREFYNDKDPAIGERAVATILAAFEIMKKHPAIGRPAISNPSLRERVIAFGNSGCVALYRIDQARKRIVILAIRHQRESGYEGGER